MGILRNPQAQCRMTLLLWGLWLLFLAATTPVAVSWRLDHHHHHHPTRRTFYDRTTRHLPRILVRGGAKQLATTDIHEPETNVTHTLDISNSNNNDNDNDDEDATTPTSSNPRPKRPLLARIFSKKKRPAATTERTPSISSSISSSCTNTTTSTATPRDEPADATSTEEAETTLTALPETTQQLPKDTTTTTTTTTSIEHEQEAPSSSTKPNVTAIMEHDASLAPSPSETTTNKETTDSTIIDDDDDDKTTLMEMTTDSEITSAIEDDGQESNDSRTIATKAGGVTSSSNTPPLQQQSTTSATSTSTPSTSVDQENDEDVSKIHNEHDHRKSTHEHSESLAIIMNNTEDDVSSISSTQQEDQDVDHDTNNNNEETSSTQQANNKDDADDDAIIRTLSLDEIYNRTQTLRAQGKELHDAQQYPQAAHSFALAAKGLDHIRERRVSSDDDDDKEDENNMVELSVVDEDWATCRLHEALCHLKAQNNNDAVLACTAVLQQPQHLGTAVRARALYRRAKAYVALEDVTLATQDARQAAFLGDTKGVELYGQLLRDHTKDVGSALSSSSSNPQSLSALLSQSSSASSRTDSDSNDPFGGASSPGDPSSLFSALLGSSGDKDAASPFGGSSSPAAALLSQALAGNANGGDGAAPFSPLSLLGNGGGGAASMVKNMISNNLDNPTVHEMICNTLQKTSSGNLQQYASAAGVNLSASQADTLAGFCQKMKPAHLKKTVSVGKAVYYVVQLVRKFFQVLTRYRPIFILLFILAWIKSLFA